MTQTKQELIVLFEQSTYKEIDGLDFLIELVNIYRKNRHSLLVEINDLLELLQSTPTYKTILITKIDALNFQTRDFDQIISDVGIINYNDFLYEVKRRLIAKIIPHQAPAESLEFVLNQIFYSRTDSDWIMRIPDEQLIRLFEIVEGKSIYELEQNNHPISEILYGLEVLTQRVSGRAMETEVSKMNPEYRNFDNPFIGLLQEM